MIVKRDGSQCIYVSSSVIDRVVYGKRKVILVLVISLIWLIRSSTVFDILVVCGFWYRAFYQRVVLFLMCSLVRIQQSEVP